jgi:hypothetical protein
MKKATVTSAVAFLFLYRAAIFNHGCEISRVIAQDSSVFHAKAALHTLDAGISEIAKAANLEDGL